MQTQIGLFISELKKMEQKNYSLCQKTNIEDVNRNGDETASEYIHYIQCTIAHIEINY